MPEAINLIENIASREELGYGILNQTFDYIRDNIREKADIR